MNVLLIVLFVVVALAAVVAIVYAIRAAAASRASRAPVEREEARPRPVLADFHVRGAEAIVVYDVPLPDGPVGDRLRDILSHDAFDVLRDKREHGLPLDKPMGQWDEASLDVFFDGTGDQEYVIDKRMRRPGGKSYRLKTEVKWAGASAILEGWYKKSSGGRWTDRIG